MEFYRYESVDKQEANSMDIYIPNPVIKLRTFYLVKETKCGYWITDIQLPNIFFNFKLSWKKWVSKTTYKRYAYPTKKEAHFSFKKRPLRRIRIINGDLKYCNVLLKMINSEKDEQI